MTGTDLELLAWALAVPFLLSIYMAICVLFVAFRCSLSDRRERARRRRARIAAHEARIAERTAQRDARPLASGIHRRVA